MLNGLDLLLVEQHSNSDKNPDKLTPPTRPCLCGTERAINVVFTQALLLWTASVAPWDHFVYSVGFLMLTQVGFIVTHIWLRMDVPSRIPSVWWIVYSCWIVFIMVVSVPLLVGDVAYGAAVAVIRGMNLTLVAEMGNVCICWWAFWWTFTRCDCLADKQTPIVACK